MMNRGTCKDQLQPTVTHSRRTPAGRGCKKIIGYLMIHIDKKPTTYLHSNFLKYHNNSRQYKCDIRNAVPVMLKVHNNMHSTHNILIECPTSKSEYLNTVEAAYYDHFGTRAF